MLQASSPLTWTWEGPHHLSPYRAQRERCTLPCKRHLPSQLGRLLDALQDKTRTRPGPTPPERTIPESPNSAQPPCSQELSPLLQKPGLEGRGTSLVWGELPGKGWLGRGREHERTWLPQQTVRRWRQRSQNTSLKLTVQLNPSQRRKEPSYCPELPGSD